MRISLCVAGSAIMFALGLGVTLPKVQAAGRLHGVKVFRQVPEEPAAEEGKAALKPEVAALIKKSTAVYAAMKSYRHNSEYFRKAQGTENEPGKIIVFTLALQRPNKFIYKADVSGFGVAVCDGKTFINSNNANLREERERPYYTKISAPASYKGINIVDDVSFTHGTYLIALMLQGDVMADGNVKAGLEHATLNPNVEDNGKKYDVLNVPFQERAAPYKQYFLHFYFDAASHLLHKAIEDVPAAESTGQPAYKMLEIIENVLVDKPLPPDTFEYKLPKNARQIVSLPESTFKGMAAAHSFTSQPLAFYAR